MNEDRHWSMVSGLRKPGDLLARSELCHLHDGREEPVHAVAPVNGLPEEASDLRRKPGR